MRRSAPPPPNASRARQQCKYTLTVHINTCTQHEIPQRPGVDVSHDVTPELPHHIDEPTGYPKGAVIFPVLSYLYSSDFCTPRPFFEHSGDNYSYYTHNEGDSLCRFSPSALGKSWPRTEGRTKERRRGGGSESRKQREREESTEQRRLKRQWDITYIK